jgi:hypothetical protein
LVQGTDGDFYGTMAFGGSGPDLFGGTAYKMTPAGNVTVLHSFTQAEGGFPLAGLRQAQDGRRYAGRRSVTRRTAEGAAGEQQRR